MGRRQLKVVRLLEPELCLSCRFAERIKAAGPDGREQILIRCGRLDCDNWDTESATDSEGLVPMDEAV